jgi:uncharacterized repeat protein (TIGR04076 family)
MDKIQIKVLKTKVFHELQQYCTAKIEKCPCFHEGQVFETTYEKPEGFCDWAWKDIHVYIASLLTGGNFSDGIFEGWMKDKNTMIACCTDGIRPVIFELKKIKDEQKNEI